MLIITVKSKRKHKMMENDKLISKFRNCYLDLYLLDD